MSASWYELLGVDRSASEAEIRAAWKDSISDLDPTDRRFALYNEAAGVLLDADARAAYDEELGPEREPEETADDAEAEDPDTEHAPTEGADPREAAAGTAEAEEPEPDEERTGRDRGGRRLPPVPTWLLAALTVLLVGALIAAVTIQRKNADRAAAEAAVTDARAAAESGAQRVLSYDYKDPEQAHDAAVEVLTGDQLEEYEKFWKEIIRPQVEKQKGVVTTRVLTSGIRTSSEDEAQVMVVAESTQRNKNNKPTTVRLPLTLSLVEEDGDWKITSICGMDDRDGPCSADDGDGE